MGSHREKDSWVGAHGSPVADKAAPGVRESVPWARESAPRVRESAPRVKESATSQRWLGVLLQAQGFHVDHVLRMAAGRPGPRAL